MKLNHCSHRPKAARRVSALVLIIALFATACGSSDPAQSIETGAAAEATPGANPDAPMPVEPDGGIGDGAEPLPGADEADDDGTWHGAQVAETNCPGTQWQRVDATAFSFSVPVNFTEQDIQPIDSEFRAWTGPDGIEFTYDYGWFSGGIGAMPGAENEAVDFSGITGEQSVIRDGGVTVGVLFEEVQLIDDTWDRLSFYFVSPNLGDEIIGRCIVGSIEWSF